ncbi:hypothetical protein IWQ60_000246 [Tieghemiomyces parasiticus]|uniref:Uncharacterized protein n=1 Tax=Tieghemiomyces parasiticus TaxID=78921 RepID=A0A9W8AGF1_9FUNG|nr:hypothetical protein IWQ60_000246 [Tieghemiomyces parasiticus]
MKSTTLLCYAALAVVGVFALAQAHGQGDFDRSAESMVITSEQPSPSDVMESDDVEPMPSSIFLPTLMEPEPTGTEVQEEKPEPSETEVEEGEEVPEETDSNGEGDDDNEEVPDETTTNGEDGNDEDGTPYAPKLWARASHQCRPSHFWNGQCHRCIRSHFWNGRCHRCTHTYHRRHGHC